MTNQINSYAQSIERYQNSGISIDFPPESQKYFDQENLYICIFEGPTDPPFYVPIIYKVLGSKIVSFYVNGREAVLKFYFEYYKKKNYKAKFLFFIDRDFHDWTGDNTELEAEKERIFITKDHSFENYIITRENFQIMLIKLYKDKYSTMEDIHSRIEGHYKKFSEEYTIFVNRLFAFTVLCLLDIKHNPNDSFINHDNFKMKHYDSLSTDYDKVYENIYQVIKEAFLERNVNQFTKKKFSFTELQNYLQEEHKANTRKEALLKDIIDPEKINTFIEYILKRILGKESIEDIKNELLEYAALIKAKQYIIGKRSLEFFKSFVANNIDDLKLDISIDKNKFNPENPHKILDWLFITDPPDLQKFLQNIKSMENQNAS